MIRWVRKDARIAAFSLCKFCGAAGGCGAGGCTTMTCRWCGTAQCSANGLGWGQCAICYHGLLEGWSHTKADARGCQYTGCPHPIVGRFPRKGYCCAEHGARIAGADYLTTRLAERATRYVATEVTT